MTPPRRLSAAERIDWLRLARTARIGPVTFAQLIARYGDADAALAALPELAARSCGKPPRPPSRDAARAELNAVEAAGGVLLAACEDVFPALLRRLDPPPPVLTVIGSTDLCARPGVGFVGARNASVTGLKLARMMAAGVGAAGFPVVSGLARGIDAAAHAAALETGTVAVVAGGADVIYPPENADLHADIAGRGAIVSENPLGVRPTARDFPRRNRLISGLSLGVVVVEAAQRSGSLITARLAGEQGREVMAAPGSPLDPRARGANALLRDGAALVETARDILDVITPLSARMTEPDPDRFSAAPPDEHVLRTGADAVRDTLRALLSSAPTPRDELVRAVGAPAASVNAALLELELAGDIHQDVDGAVSRVWDTRDD